MHCCVQYFVHLIGLGNHVCALTSLSHSAVASPHSLHFGMLASQFVTVYSYGTVNYGRNVDQVPNAATLVNNNSIFSIIYKYK